MSKSTIKERGSRKDMSSGYFVALLIAVDRGDYQAAAKAQSALNQLGWDVRRTTPSGADSEQVPRLRPS
jgi:hypothetical protein